MRVAIDATSVPAKPAGAGVYAIELVRAMAERPARDGYAVFTRGPWFDALGAKPNWRIERVQAPTRARRLLWEQAALPGRVGALGIDVLHGTHHGVPVRPMRARRVVTVHDLTFLRIPQRYPPARRLYMQTITQLGARVADAIIAPSRVVREDIERLLPAGRGKVHVVHEAPAARYRPMARDEALGIARGYGIEPPYVLSVGSLEPGKNRRRVLEALAALRAEGVTPQFAIVGQPAWKYEEDAETVRVLGLEQQVRFLGYVPDDDLPALYAGADVFAYPSLYEGFGLCVLEAMACGTPVLTSAVSATAEVAGDAALLVDPASVDAIRDGLRGLLGDAGARRELSERGLARAAEFTWRRAADETYEVYAQTFEEPR